MTTEPGPSAAPHTVYTGRTSNWQMVAGTSAGAALLVIMGWAGQGGWLELGLPIALLVIGIALNVATAASLRASAGPNGLDIRWGIASVRCAYPLERIARAEVIQVPWWRVTYGLWWTPRGTSCTVRSGDALRLTLTNGRLVTVTVPDPDLAVAAIESARA